MSIRTFAALASSILALAIAPSALSAAVPAVVRKMARGHSFLIPLDAPSGRE